MNRGLSGNWNRDTDWQMLIQLRFCVIRIVTFAGPSLIMAPGFIVPPQPDEGRSAGKPPSVLRTFSTISTISTAPVHPTPLSHYTRHLAELISLSSACAHAEVVLQFAFAFNLQANWQALSQSIFKIPILQPSSVFLVFGILCFNKPKSLVFIR